MGLGVPWLLGLTLELGERLVVTGLPGDLDAVDLSPVSKFSGFPKEISDERFARASGDKERSHRSWGCSPRVRSCRPRSEVGEGEFSSECTCRSLDLNGKRTPSERPKLLPELDWGSSCHSALSAHSAIVAGICSASWTLPEWMTVIRTSRPLQLGRCPESLEPHRGGFARGQLWTSPPA